MRSVAQHLAAKLRATTKQQGLSVRQVAAMVSEATGRPCAPYEISRRLNGERPMAYVADIYTDLAAALGLDPGKELLDAYETALAELDRKKERT